VGVIEEEKKLTSLESRPSLFARKKTYTPSPLSLGFLLGNGFNYPDFKDQEGSPSSSSSQDFAEESEDHIGAGAGHFDNSLHLKTDQSSLPDEDFLTID